MKQVPLQIRVECYAGYRGEETPRRFFLGARRIEIAELLDRWLGEDHRYFKLRSVEGDLYILRHDPRAGCWELTFFEAKNRSPDIPPLSRLF
ncbi:hypothetical protein DESUT3_13070 [Desulfuromonas versatilis]|uniref:Cytoplasmic protein n=1 Tax=Desulfuromonas versatilis TaxID=2802975 RepID=A0ABM8HUQ6_9BACT|nr:hypothetical protein [Desulfuromonas versatilis]BCR04238.1 hypothetical protein DESUT3_13070 [Desulfuromonas versatilis]